jgi:hypothetical protein
MATPPQAAINAPKGASNPHIFTAVLRRCEKLPKVVARIR